MEILIYLDTHVVIWLYAGKTEHIPYKTLELMKTQELLLSPMVLLEMTYLFEIKRLTVLVRTQQIPP
ncbi:PilT protein domain-containing protein [Thioploca ingrica]|uniref:PilT protein domain-containing protein n=1 Tax=Thioploca ingrica TaxID=40754 RepID=A0A090ACB1_9GAMM|nr:PilT protein domain-containing protein [Thioploca ingrica]